MEKLRHLTERVYCYPCEERRDRPLLGYVRGDHLSLAVDAGHSGEHVEEFYAALQQEGLPLPDITVLTHWHWDHTFGMHAIHGISIAGAATDRHLEEIRERMNEAEVQRYLAMDPHIGAEYSSGQPMKVVTADMVYRGELEIDLGGTRAILTGTVSPHTEDSTIIYLPQENVLFLGDCVSGEYPEWKVDPEKMKGLIQTIERIPAHYCITGHWQEETREELLPVLRKDAGL